MEIQNETVVDRLAEKLKSAQGSEFFDEKDLAELSQGAIHKAFFEPRRVTKCTGYNQTTTIEQPLIVTMAEEAFKPYVEEKIKAAVDAIAATPEFHAALCEAMAGALPAIMLKIIDGQMHSIAMRGDQNAVRMLTMRLQQGG